MVTRAGNAVSTAALALLLAGGCDDRQRTIDSEGPAAQPTHEATAVPTPETPLPAAQPPIAHPSGQISPLAQPRAFATPVAATPTKVTLPGPWPTDALRDYSHDFNVGTPKGVAFDEALNLWLLDGDRIGVLRPGDSAPKWTVGIGQAKGGFGYTAMAIDSTVICGGAAGRAYVGYRTYDLEKTIPDKPHAFIPWPGEPYYTPERFAEYQRGDMDAVRLQPDGSVALEEHLHQSIVSFR